MYIYAHPLAGLNLTLTMHINSGFLSFSVIDTIEKEHLTSNGKLAEPTDVLESQNKNP